MKTAAAILEEKNLEIISVEKDATIYDALNLMNHYGIGAILVKDRDEIVGIWTERDLLKSAGNEDFDIKTAKIGDHMSTHLVSCEHTDTVYGMMDVFLGKRLRHLLVKKDGKYIGLLSQGDVVKASLFEKSQELESLNAMVSWEYYSNWQWKKKK